MSLHGACTCIHAHQSIMEYVITMMLATHFSLCIPDKHSHDSRSGLVDSVSSTSDLYENSIDSTKH